MPRELKLQLTKARLFTNFFVIYSHKGTWEEPFTVLQGTPIGQLVSKVDLDSYNHALHGYGSPLDQKLGTPPIGCLIKLTRDGLGACRLKDSCASYQAKFCEAKSKPYRVCFDCQVQGASEIVRYWASDTYVLVVEI